MFLHPYVDQSLAVASPGKRGHLEQGSHLQQRQSLMVFAGSTLSSWGSTSFIPEGVSGWHIIVATTDGNGEGTKGRKQAATKAKDKFYLQFCLHSS